AMAATAASTVEKRFDTVGSFNSWRWKLEQGSASVFARRGTRRRRGQRVRCIIGSSQPVASRPLPEGGLLLNQSYFQKTRCDIAQFKKPIPPFTARNTKAN